jgi:hypothetical protein
MTRIIRCRFKNLLANKFVYSKQQPLGRCKKSPDFKRQAYRYKKGCIQ